MGMIAIWGPPNSGKTTLAIDLAFALTRYGKSVCLLSPEPYSELGARLGLSIEASRSLAAASKVKGTLEQIALGVSDLLFLLAAPADADAFSEDAGSDGARRLLETARDAFDAVLIDCPAGTDSALAAWSLQRSDAVLMLSGCRSASGLWFSAYRRVIETLSSKVIPLCLEASRTFDYPGLLKITNMTPAMWIPFYPEAEETQAERQTLYGSGGRIGKAYTDALNELCEILPEGGEEE